MGMSNELTKVEASTPTTNQMALAGLQEAVQRLYGSIEREGGHDVLPSLPAPQVRARMRERQLTLRSVLRPISLASEEQKRARDAIAGLLGGYLNIRTDNPAAIAAGYTAHLGEQPLFAILAACDDFRHHRVVDYVNDEGKEVYFTLDHAPSAFRLLDQVKKRAADAQSEHFQINRVLAITKIKPRALMTEDEERRVAEGLRTLANGMLKRVTKDAEEERKKNSAEAAAARDRMRGIIEEAARRRAADLVPTIPDHEFYEQPS